MACRDCGPELAASLQCQHMQKWRNYSGGLVCSFLMSSLYYYALFRYSNYLKKQNNKKPIPVHKLSVLHQIPGKLPDILTLFWNHASLQYRRVGFIFREMPVKNMCRDWVTTSSGCSNWCAISLPLLWIIQKLVKEMRCGMWWRKNGM